MKYLFNRIVAGTLVALSPVFVMAQTWIPTKAITYVVPVTSGSSNDLIARMLSEELPAKLGQPVIVDNRPDTSALVGAVSVARSSPDGHTIVMVSSDVYMAPMLTPKAEGANFDIIKDFSLIPTAGSAPMLIVASQSINVKTPEERAAVLTKSGATSYGSPGTGSPMNIASEMLKRYNGMQIHHVPYRDVLSAVNALLADKLPISILALAGEAPHIATRKPRHEGLIEKQRSELISTMPTMTESGIAGVEPAVIFQILAPSTTPGADIQRPNTDINAVLATSEFRDKLRGMGVQIEGGTSGDAAKLVRDTCAPEQQVVKDLNIPVECTKS